MSSSQGPGRPKKPGARTATISTKISEDDLGLIRARCAALGITPSAWLQRLLTASLANIRDGGEALPGIRLLIDPDMPPGTVALTSPGSPAVATVNVSPDCPHRLNPGAYCKTCGKNKT